MEKSGFNPDAKKSSLIIGRHPVLEALLGDRPVEKILFQQQVSGENIGQIRQLAKEKNIPIQQVPAEKLNGLTRGRHQGVLAFAALITYYDLQDVISEVVEIPAIPLFVMLDGITDVRNIGAIARSAVGCGAHALIIPDKGVGALNEEAMKTSAGALEKIRVCRVGSLMKAVDTLHLNGILVFASTRAQAIPVFEADLSGPVCLVMGSEDKGIYPALEKICDQKIHIPMAGDFESLNVSVAAGILLYEAMKQRMHFSLAGRH